MSEVADYRAALLIAVAHLNSDVLRRIRMSSETMQELFDEWQEDE